MEVLEVSRRESDGIRRDKEQKRQRKTRMHNAGTMVAAGTPICVCGVGVSFLCHTTHCVLSPLVPVKIDQNERENTVSGVT